jgi:hypothetical protein
MVSYLIIYLKNTKHNEIKEKARRIQAGMCTEPKLPATDTPAPILSACCQSLLPACVFVIRDTVRHARRFCSEKLFVNGGVREPRFQCIYIHAKYSDEHLANKFGTHNASLPFIPQTPYKIHSSTEYGVTTMEEHGFPHRISVVARYQALENKRTQLALFPSL